MIVRVEILGKGSIHILLPGTTCATPARIDHTILQRGSSMAARKKTSKRKYGKAASKRVGSAMRRRKKGTLKSGRSGKTVKSRKQAIAIGLSEARKKGAKVPRKRTGRKSSGGRKSGARKRSSSR
jgi:hypothetical protein